MRKIYFSCILLVGLLTGCGDKNKPKEVAQCKDAVVSTTGVVSTTRTVDTLSSKEAVNDTLKSAPKNKGPVVKPTQSKIDNKIEPQKQEEPNQLARVVLIITSQACHCTLERCAQGEKIVKEMVQQFSQKLVFEKLDYAKEQDSVVQLAKEYQLRFLPGLLFFDKKGTFNGKMEGSLDKVEVEKKLKEIGVE